MQDEQTARSLRELLDREAIRDLLIRYATGVDSRDWALFRSCFCDPVEIDLCSWTGAPPGDVSADEWVDSVRTGLAAFDVTHHMSSNHCIELAGDRAICHSYVQARHCIHGPEGDEIFSLGGHYRTRLLRQPEGWRIRASRLAVTWSQGDRSLFTRSRA